VYNVKNLNAEGKVSCQNCGRWILAEGQSISVMPAETAMETYVPYEKREEETSLTVAKLYGHGFLFSILSLFIAFLYIFLAVFLAYLGGIIGLVLSIVILCGMIGSVNLGLANVLWGIRCKHEPQSVVAQGGVIFLILVVMSVVFLPFTGFAFQIVLLLDFLVYPFIYGFVCRSIALQFEIIQDEEDRAISSDYRKGVCPHCSAKYAYALPSRDSDGNVRCQNCSQVFKLQIGPELQSGPDID
jgi:transcription elongation factor Elf1